MVEFHSKFGGMWIDDLDSSRVDRKVSAIADPTLRDRVGSFARDGFVIMEQGVSHASIDAYLADYEKAADIPDAFQVDVRTGRQAFTREKSLIPGVKVLDTGMLMPHGQDLCFAPNVTNFLEAIFEEKALAFQTLHFEVGSTQAVHQDSAYVVVRREPLKFIASWIALQDVQPGSGELIYYAGGHRIGETSYDGGSSKHWDPKRDGHPPHDAHLRYLREESARRGFPEQRFLPRKGDVLFWHADLPHGGGKITVPGVQRRSLVTHYCPKSLAPHYIDFIRPEWRQKTEARDGNAFISLFFPPSRFMKVAE